MKINEVVARLDSDRITVNGTALTDEQKKIYDMIFNGKHRGSENGIEQGEVARDVYPATSLSNGKRLVRYRIEEMRNKGIVIGSGNSGLYQPTEADNYFERIMAHGASEMATMLKSQGITGDIIVHADGRYDLRDRLKE